MKIAYICADRGIPVDGTKGASIHVRSVIRALAGRGHQMKLLAARSGSMPDGFPAMVTDIGFDRWLKQLRLGIEEQGQFTLAREAYSLVLNTNLRQTLSELHSMWPVEAVYERYSLWSWAGLHFARERGVPYLLEVNAPLVQEQQSYRELSLGPVAHAIAGLLMREADAVLVPSPELRRHVWQAAAKRRRVDVVGNGADLDLFRRPPIPPPAALARRLQGRYVVAFLGTLKPWHGLRPLLRAFRRLRQVNDKACLLVIGDGPGGDLVQEAQRRHGPRTVIWTGAVKHEDVPGWLSLAHVGVAPYPEMESFYFCPLKIIEYLAAGLPVVASAIGDAARLVSHQRTGLLVPPGDSAGLARALAALGDNTSKRLRMGERAQQRARRRHGWERAAVSIERIIHRTQQRAARQRLPALMDG